MNVVAEPMWEDRRLSPVDAAIKRLLDWFVAALALIALLPVMVIIAMAIKFDSPGSVLFTQVRVGTKGRKFCLYKFRSMARDAEDVRCKLLHLNEASGPVFKITNDPRITRVGHFLRKYSLDELPQLINVLRGDMSLVGPRPPLPCEVEQYTTHEWKRLSITPGITCMWQISGRSNIPFAQWVEMDLDYIRRQSLWLDAKILVLTLPAVILGRGAR